MDPGPITSSAWAQIGQAVDYLWLFLASMVAFLGSTLLAFGLLPSFVGSGHLPPRILRLRPLLYLVVLAALAAAGFSLARAVNLATEALDFYPRFWM